VTDHPDVVVRFDKGGHRFVFWRGTSYIPCWVTDNGVWYTNEFVERRGHHSPNTEGCVEPMSDKQCRYSHVRVIESNAARVVVHWRYAPVDVHYEHSFIDPQTGWYDWVDEYYTIYPNAVAVRKITVFSNRLDLWTEFQESIVVNQPGTLPDEHIELGAVSVCNMDGESRTYMWTEQGGPEFDGPKDCNILRINLKSKLKPFAFIAPPESDGRILTSYAGHAEGSHFNWWDHWPVSQAASDGRVAVSKDRPSHSSLCHIALKEPETWEPYARSEESVTKLLVHGMTDRPVKALVPLAESWLSAPELRVSGDTYVNEGYDQTQMAYVLASQTSGQAAPCTVEIAASEGSPVIQPAFVIKGWGTEPASVTLNGTRADKGKTVRIGHRHTLDGSDLVVWIDCESTDPLTLTLNPASRES
jgi:hypothetical protein